MWWAAPAIAALSPLLALPASRQEPPPAPPPPAPPAPTQEAPVDDERGEEIEDASEPAETVSAAKKLGRLEALAYFGSEFHPRQAPFLVRRADGRLLFGNLETEPGAGDRIELRDATGVDGPSEALEVRRVSEARGEIVRPIAVSDRDGKLVVLWTDVSGDRPQLRAAFEAADGFGEPVALTQGPPADLNPEAVLHSDGRIFVAWESDVPRPGARPSRDVLVAPLDRDSGLGRPVRAGDGRASDVDPLIASAGGKLWIAWTSYRGRDYDVMLRSFDPENGELGPTINVSADAASDDVHPALVASPAGDLWLAWDRVEVARRGAPAPNLLLARPVTERISVELRCACVRDGRVLLPPAGVEEVAAGVVPGAPNHSTGGGSPRLAFDAAGRLWIAYRYLLRRHDSSPPAFPLIVQHLGAAGWSAPRQIASSHGLPEEPAIVPARDGVAIAFQRDERAELRVRERRHPPDELTAPLAKRSVQCTLWHGVESIGLARDRAQGEAAPPPLVPREERLDPPHYHPAADRLDDPIVSGERHFEVTRGEQRWRVYWGDLHQHSSVSRCSRGTEPTPEDRWTTGRDAFLCDFMALTDHTAVIVPSTWWQLDKLCQLHQSETFCALSGWEWSSRRYGHHNVILPGRMSCLVSEDETLETLYRRLPPGACVTIPHHSADEKFPNDFEAVDDRFTRLIEIYQACRGSFEFDGCFRQAPWATVPGSFAQDALSLGHEFGIIASSDHGYRSSYACVLAERLDRASVFEALHARRTYGATAKGMLIDLRVNDAVMGESIEVEAGRPLALTLEAKGVADLADVVVFRNGRVFRSLRGEAALQNAFAPTRLVLRLDDLPRAGGGGPRGSGAQSGRGSFELSLRVAGGSFGELRLRGEPGKPLVSNGWSAKGEGATFLLPRERAGESFEAAVHLFARSGSELELRAPDGERTVELADLVRAPASGRAPDGATWSLSLELGDAAIALSPGLGRRELRCEWTEPEPASGTAWYYARIVQVDGDMAWSSPVFVRRR